MRHTWTSLHVVILGAKTSQITASRLFSQQFIQALTTKTPKRRVTGLYAGNSPVTGEFPSQTASNAENVSVWLRHHDNGDFCAQEVDPGSYIKIHCIF